jgi:hypothetical protein
MKERIVIVKNTTEPMRDALEHALGMILYIYIYIYIICMYVCMDTSSSSMCVCIYNIYIYYRTDERCTGACAWYDYVYV